jgi:hypothetical protein
MKMKSKELKRIELHMLLSVIGLVFCIGLAYSFSLCLDDKHEDSAINFIAYIGMTASLVLGVVGWLIVWVCLLMEHKTVRLGLREMERRIRERDHDSRKEGKRVKVKIQDNRHEPVNTNITG